MADRLLVYVTPGESLSDAFPSWLRLCYDGLTYRPYDMNMPPSIPRRPPSHLAVDPPLTEHGEVVGQLTGKTIRLAAIQPVAIFSSPEHRCVQTAAAIVKALKMPCYIFVENGLQAWSQLTASPFRSLFPRDFSQLGFPVFEGYRPIVPVVDTLSESLIEFTDRIHIVTQHIVQSLEGPTLIVADSSVAVLANNQAFRQPQSLLEARSKLPPCSVSAFQVDDHNNLTRSEKSIMSVTATLHDAREKRRK